VAGSVFVGCCGWQESRARYFAEFPVVELQDTFYQPPSVELASKWRSAAPEGFRFSMKAWQLITHAASSPTYRRLKEAVAKSGACGYFRPTDEVRAAWQRTLAIARALDAVAIVFQCPASFRETPANIANLTAFFEGIERDDRLLAWEPRGPWRAEAVREICAKLDLVHCVDPFQAQPVHGQAVYWRLHGIGGYACRYSDEELERLREMVQRQRTAGRDPVYVMFNNTNMLEDARRFRGMV
jgi:uncharacterized protein YecE (DUF72 family)